MKLLSKIRHVIKSVKKNESGSMTVDSVLIFPVLIWTISGSFTFFEGFRQSSINLKAAYTVGDLISRETTTVTDTYVQSMHLLMYRMVEAESPMSLRVSFVVFDKEDDRHYVRWSTTCGDGYAFAWTDDNIGTIRNNLPPMPDQDSLIIVETTNKFVPAFGYQWINEGYTFDNFVFTRPRFTNEVAGFVTDNACQVEPVATATTS